MTHLYSIIALLFLLPITNEVAVCDCVWSKNWRKAIVKEYESVDDVFIGEVKSISDDNLEYEVIVTDVLKGNLKVGTAVTGINPIYCDPIVDKKGPWLFFGTLLDNFYLNECGYTSNIEKPWSITPPPPPPPPELKLDEKKMLDKWKETARETMQEQLTILRNIKQGM